MTIFLVKTRQVKRIVSHCYGIMHLEMPPMRKETDTSEEDDMGYVAENDEVEYGK